MTVESSARDSDEEQPNAAALSALVHALRAEHERLAAEVVALREEIAALRRQLPSAPPLRPRPRVGSGGPPSSIARRGVDSIRQFGTAAASVARIPFRLQPWAIALTVALFMVVSTELNAFQPLEVFVAYVKTAIRGTAPFPQFAERVVVVTIDEASLARLGPWGPQWRTYHGQLLKHLADAGARAVGFDLNFKSPHDELDRAFAEEILDARARGLRVVLGAEYDAANRRVIEPPPALLTAATAIGSTSLTKDRVTNLVRYVAPFQEDRHPDLGGQVRLLPSLSAAVAMAAGKRAEDLRSVGEDVVPIDFAGGSRAFRTISYADVYAGRFPPTMFKGRHVMVGAVFQSSRDFFDTPSESQVAGVFVHASALYTLLRGLPRRLPLAQDGVLLGAVGIVTVLCLRFQGMTRLVLIVTVGAIYWAAALTLAAEPRPVDLDIVPATLTMALVWAALVMAEKARVREELRRTLGLPDDALRRLESEPGLLAGTLVKPVTVLAIDARDYSVFTHAHTPEHVRDIILQYHEVIERVVDRHGGYVNKFVGDAVLVVFGYPRSEKDTATRAILAAVEVHDEVRALRARWAREGKSGIAGLRMGVSTGPVSISYQGSSKKQLDILGENIDLATRLEDAARDFDNAIALLSAATYERVKDRVRARCVGVTLKHLPHVTTAYAVEEWMEAATAGAADAEAQMVERR